MKLITMWISGFQSFGEDPTEIKFEDMVFLLGPNGAGKTAVLEALCRLFSFNSNLKRVLPSDFHVPVNEVPTNKYIERKLWIEVDFEFPELEEDAADGFAIPANFAHMRLQTHDGVPVVRFRFEAKMDIDGEIESSLNYVLEVDEQDEPASMTLVPKQERNSIHIHYLPARRDPSEHISYSTSSLMGRILRAANWSDERGDITDLTTKINDKLSGNASISGLSHHLEAQWKSLHKGAYFSNAKISFLQSEIESLLRHLSVTFTPGHGQDYVDFLKLSDGQKSLLYLSLVLAVHKIGQDVLSGENEDFDIEKLRPPIFTIIAMEEPENSLSAHYLGRIIRTLTEYSEEDDAQVVVATHSPSLLSRVPPENIRYLRLDKNRQTQVKEILLPSGEMDSYKYIRQAVQAFPELYFSRLVILGEGDSEKIVLSRLLQAKGLEFDNNEISIVPLGGRHVNHFWRLLHGLEIPFVTLLDLDVGRYQGGWGRISYAAKQLLQFPPENCTITKEHVKQLPKWNSDVDVITSDGGWISCLESYGVFFSSPLDLDFSMLTHFSEAFDIDEDATDEPDQSLLKAVLGKSYHHEEFYSEDDRHFFVDYHQLFKLGSKPAAHIEALGSLSDKKLKKKMPDPYVRLFDAVEKILESLPE